MGIHSETKTIFTIRRTTLQNHLDAEQIEDSKHRAMNEDGPVNKREEHAGHGHDAAAWHSGHNMAEMDHSGMDHSKMDHSQMDHSGMDHSHMHHMGGDRPMLATVLAGVSHCGAGCVLGDIVGEWLVYGNTATINGRGIWVELLVNYGLALLFSIVFQYFSITPMSRDYRPKTVIRAMKADILSLTSFEIGLLGWMIIHQIGIWNHRLEMATVTYWCQSKWNPCFKVYLFG